MRTGMVGAPQRIVGREAELDRLGAALTDVADGSGRVVLLSGESGIGKTRLAAEVAAQAEQRGFVSLAGRAHPLHAGLAYAPIVEALSPLLTGHDEHARAALLSGLPGSAELGMLFPGLPGPLPRPLGDPSLEKTRLFEATAALLRRLARRSPAAVWLDDVHVADPATVELTHYLCRAVADQRLLVMLTWRGGDPTGPLAELVRSLRRSATTVEVSLTRLSDPAVVELIADVLGERPSSELVAAVAARAAGVPLFITALVRQLVDSGSVRRGPTGWVTRPGGLPGLPRIVRDAVMGQLARLTSEERSLFELVSVAGTAATSDVLQSVSDENVDTPLRALLASGLLAERAVGRDVLYEVAHPLYAEVAYAELSALERRRVHAKVATALDRLNPDDVVSLAPHVIGAGDLIGRRRLLDVLAAAGERALGLHADIEAARYLGSAVELARELRRTDLLPALLAALGNALERLGDLDRAVLAWQEALATAPAALAAQLRNRLALLEWERGNHRAAERHMAELATVPGWGDELEHLFFRLTIISRGQDLATTVAATRRLETLAGQLSAPGADAVLHLARSYLALFEGPDYPAARCEAERALAGAAHTESSYTAAGPHRVITISTLASGDLAAGRAHGTLAVRLLQRDGVPPLECSLRVILAAVLLLGGDWDGADAELIEAVALGRRSASARSLAIALGWQGLLRAYRGDIDPARACVAEAEQAAVGADRHVSDDLAVVRATVARLAGSPPVVLPYALPVEGSRYPLVLSLLGEARLAAGDKEGAAAVISRLRRFRGDVPLARAFADRLAGLHGADPAVLRAAEGAFDKLGLPFEAARAALERAEIEPDIHAATAALAVFDRLRANPWADRARRMLRSAGVRLSAPGRRGRGSTLSAREWEVAGMVAAGLSNTDIAARLFLSVRTVEAHLRKVYAKLGLGSRVALAQWVGEQQHR